MIFDHLAYLVIDFDIMIYYGKKKTSWEEGEGEGGRWIVDVLKSMLYIGEESKFHLVQGRLVMREKRIVEKVSNAMKRRD